MSGRLRCYVCGNPVGIEFALVSMQPNADRVFIIELRCVERVEDRDTVINVKRELPKIIPPEKKKK